MQLVVHLPVAFAKCCTQSSILAMLKIQSTLMHHVIMTSKRAKTTSSFFFFFFKGSLSSTKEHIIKSHYGSVFKSSTNKNCMTPSLPVCHYQETLTNAACCTTTLCCCFWRCCCCVVIVVAAAVVIAAAAAASVFAVTVVALVNKIYIYITPYHLQGKTDHSPLLCGGFLFHVEP